MVSDIVEDVIARELYVRSEDATIKVALDLGFVLQFSERLVSGCTDH
jgi:hypothetical protein